VQLKGQVFEILEFQRF